MMRRYSSVVGLALCLAVAVPASATFHIMIIEQLFPGFESAPDAQYIMLQLQAPVQIAVYEQPFPVYNATGAAQSPFAAFCSTPRAACSLPRVSPACNTPGCPNALEANGSNILVATRWAQGLFCVTADLLASGDLPYPDGRACFGDCGLRDDCGTGPVDCVAYGTFSGDNGVFGQPALTPDPGMALVASPDRTNQFITGHLLDSRLGFSPGAPTPQNFHGDAGRLDGLEGDANGDRHVNETDVRATAAALFGGGQRCDLPAAQRGADANLDTRVSAADLISTIRVVTAARV